MASRAAAFERDSSLPVGRGLHVLRYETRGAGHDHPVALVRAAEGYEGLIQIISAPGGAAGRLDRPGAAVLVRAEHNGKIQIGIRRSASNGSLDAAFRLESIGLLSDDDRGPGIAAPANDPDPAARLAIPPRGDGAQEALFLAHVSMRGDVSVQANEWVGGPDAPGRIEGLAILGGGAEETGTEVQVLPRSRSAIWSEWSGSRTFVGTRGRNLPLFGVRLRLTGDDSHRFVVQAEALFLGAAITSKRGREVEFVSHTGRDPLVGLRFEICPERRATSRLLASSVTKDDHPRVRIFRANEE
jgi:hypothetical protein